MMHENDKNGILAWFDMRKDHDNDGSKTLRMETLSRAINGAYDSSVHRSLAVYLDIFMTSIHELEVLQEFDFQDADKRRRLMANLSGHTEINYLLQACRDKKDLTFVEAVNYLRENSLTIEGHSPSKKRVLYASGNTDDNTVTSERSLVETVALFEQFAKETNIF
jgi:hypothetical protein